MFVLRPSKFVLWKSRSFKLEERTPPPLPVWNRNAKVLDVLCSLIARMLLYCSLQGDNFHVTNLWDPFGNRGQPHTSGKIDVEVPGSGKFQPGNFREFQGISRNFMGIPWNFHELSRKS